MMLLMNQSAANEAVVMNWGRPSNVKTARRAAAQRMAFAIIMAESCFLKELSIEADME